MRKLLVHEQSVLRYLFDIENELVNELELFGDIELVNKDTYMKWTGQDRTHNGKVLLKKGKIMTLFVYRMVGQ